MKVNLVRWLRPEEKTKDQLLDDFIMEQLVTTLNPSVKCWVQRNHPANLEAAIRLIEDFHIADENSHDSYSLGIEKSRQRGRDKMATGGVPQNESQEGMNIKNVRGDPG